MENISWPKLGCGVGLRTPHYAFITKEWPKVDWFEAITENYMDSGGKPISILEQIRSHYPVALHGVALSIGSVDPLNERYLQRLKTLVERIQPVIVSDHLCWSGAGGEQLHDLLPLPFTEESIAHVAARVSQVQDFLKRPILLENVSTYVTYQHSVVPEWEFLSEVARRSGCGILLDINNIYVNSKNHGFDPYLYLSNIPGEKIGQFHLAGHTDMGTYLFDTHSAPVIEEVWNLYRYALKQWGQISTLVEWDEKIPDWPELMEERDRAKVIYDQYAGHAPEIKNTPSQKVSYSAPKSKKGASLREVQDWMKSRIQTAGEIKAGESLLNPQGGEAGEERISVYAGGYSARMQDGLSDVYETVQQILGEDAFGALSERYAQHYPSHEYNLSMVGRHLPQLIRKFPVKDKPYLEDLAEFEWKLTESFHAFDERPFDRSQLAKIPLDVWESARLHFQPSVILFSSDWPVLDLWKNRHNLKPEAKVEKKSQLILIGRRGVQMRCEVLDKTQFRMLEGLMKGRLLGEVCEELAETIESENLPIAEWFAGWVTDGLITRCEIVESTPQ